MLIEQGYRFHVQFHITNRCNLKCKHCYEDKNCNVIDWAYEDFVIAISKLWSAFEKWGVKGEISLIGGEPTLHPRFYDMIHYLRQRGDVYGISVLTNGTLVDDRFVREMQENNCFVQVSIDGVSEEKHDFIRGEGNYKRTIEGIEMLHEFDIPLSVHYVLSKKTVPLNAVFFDNLVSKGVGQIAFSRLVPFGNANKEDMLSKEEIRTVFEFIEEMRCKYEGTGLYFSNTRPLWCNFGHEGKCPVAFQTITVLENGDLMPCRRLPIVLGNIKSDSFYKIWYTHEVLENIRNRKSIVKCGSCENVDICGGARCIAYAVSGDYMGEDPQCWLI